MSSRALLFGVALLLAEAAGILSCGTKSPCNAMLCEGCCDPSGVCLAGTATAACGSAGASCRRCMGADVCLGGTCTPSMACSSTPQCTVLDCRCGDGANAQARECRGGRCLSPTELCDDACVASGHPRPGSSDGGSPGYSFCVDGTMSSCFGADLDWSGGRCCVTVGYGQCADGTAAACFGADLEWTGATCCIKAGYGQCVAGDAASCTGDLMEWTGLQCCVRDTYYLCVDGTASFCGGSDLAWTGSQCCAATEYTRCVDGTAAACASPNLRWTGAKCCVRNLSTCVDAQQATCTGEWTGSKCCT